MVTTRYSFRENIELAKVKNRAESIQLTKQLSLIDQQKHEELKLLSEQCKKMAKKNYKLHCTTTGTGTINPETPEVVMFETHTPGFCYRCNGEQKIPSVPLSIVTVEYNCLRDLVFTDDLLDIEKLLVLHLISVHKSETLAPVRDLKLASMYKDTSPTARLLEKSKKLGFVVNKTMMDLLPFYTIEIKDDPIQPNKLKSSNISMNSTNKMAHRILFNENLRKLISTVVAVLHSSNFPKFRQLIQLAHDPNSIRAMLSKPHILEFVEFLSEQQIVNSCENFVLTPPFKLKTRDLNIQTLTETLENLIKNLRGNVLQLPKRENRITNEGEGNKTQVFYTVRSVKRKFSEVMTSNNGPRNPRLSITSNTSKDDNDDISSKYRRSSRGSEIPDFISKNIKTVGKTRKIEYDTEDIATTDNNSKRSSNSSSRSRKVEKLSILKNMPLPKLDEVNREDSPNTNENTPNPIEMLNANSTTPKISIIGNHGQDTTEIIESRNSSRMVDALIRTNKPKYETFGTGYGKYNIKITTCKACMEKWKQPLPIPKTPRVKKSSVLPILKNQLYKTDSKNRIDMLINKELYTLESYDRRFSSSNSSKRSSKKESQTDSYDNININPMYLARIEQEIRVKETQKKLEKFLNDPI